MHVWRNEPPDIKLKTDEFPLGTNFTCIHKSKKLKLINCFADINGYHAKLLITFKQVFTHKFKQQIKAGRDKPFYRFNILLLG